LSREFGNELLILIGIALGVCLVVSGLIFAGSTRRSRRYRPGRPFSFTPVWFLAAPERQVTVGRNAGRELMAGSAEGGSHRPRHGETGGASDRW
jgi:hypothetical protein